MPSPGSVGGRRYCLWPANCAARADLGRRPSAPVPGRVHHELRRLRIRGSLMFRWLLGGSTWEEGEQGDQAGLESLCGGLRPKRVTRRGASLGLLLGE